VQALPTEAAFRQFFEDFPEISPSG
jgi:hypothetical protein